MVELCLICPLCHRLPCSHFPHRKPRTCHHQPETNGTVISSAQPFSDIKLYIGQFWDKFGGSKSDGWNLQPKEKMAELKRMSTLVFKYKARPLGERRRQFYKVKYKRHSLRAHGKCFVCRHLADVRHHIVLLGNGGIDSKRNLVSLCRSCHSVIHPWLNKQRGVSTVIEKQRAPLDTLRGRW